MKTHTPIMTLEDELNRIKAERDALLATLEYIDRELYKRGFEFGRLKIRAAIALTEKAPLPPDSERG